jgi:hypothetical protein
MKASTPSISAPVSPAAELETGLHIIPAQRHAAVKRSGSQPRQNSGVGRRQSASRSEGEGLFRFAGGTPPAENGIHCFNDARIASARGRSPSIPRTASSARIRTGARSPSLHDPASGRTKETASSSGAGAFVADIRETSGEAATFEGTVSRITVRPVRPGDVPAVEGIPPTGAGALNSAIKGSPRAERWSSRFDAASAP